MANEIIRINEANQEFCSIDMVNASFEEKKAAYNAINNAEKKISDFINMKLLIKDVYMEQVELTDEKTGETRKAVRTVIITPEGEGVSCTSNGVAKSMYGLFQMFGTPDQWNGEIIEVIVRQIETAKGRTFKFEIA